MYKRQHRYGKRHTCHDTILVADQIFPKKDLGPTPFARAMYDEFKHDKSISTFDAYKRYVASKPWVCNNYLRKPDRKPNWV